MQNNPFNEAFLNEAWDDMRSQLDVVMPVENRRRLLILWWLSGAALMLILATILGVGEKNEPTMLQAGTDAKQMVEEFPNQEQPEVAIAPETISAIITATQVAQNPAESSLAEAPVLTFEENSMESAIENIRESVIQDINLENSTRESSQIARIAPLKALPTAPMEALFTDSLILTFTPSKNSLAINNKTKQLSFLSYSEAHYEARLSQWSATIGMGAQYDLGWFSLGLSPGLQWGRAALDFSSRGESLFAAAEKDNKRTSPGTAFQPSFSSVDPREIEFRFTNIRLPVHVSYRFGEKWTMETGVIWNNILKFSAIDQNDTEAYRSFQQNNTAPLAAEESGHLSSLLQKRSFLQGHISVHYQLGNHWQLYSAYQHALSSVLANDQLEWNRNYATIGLRYEINPYIPVKNNAVLPKGSFPTR